MESPTKRSTRHRINGLEGAQTQGTIQSQNYSSGYASSETHNNNNNNSNNNKDKDNKGLKSRRNRKLAPVFRVSSRTSARPSKEARLRASAKRSNEETNSIESNSKKHTNNRIRSKTKANNEDFDKANKKISKEKDDKTNKGNSKRSKERNTNVRERSSDKGSGNTREDREARLKMERINRERHRWISRWSKYGTWRDLQKLYEEKRKKRAAPPPDTIHEDVLKSVEGDLRAANIVEERIRRDVFLLGLCQESRDFVSVVAKVVSNFGANVALNTKTQILSFYTLSRLSLPSEICRSLAHLCFHALLHNHSALTATLDHDRKQQVTHYVFTVGALSSHTTLRISSTALEHSLVAVVRRQFANSTAEINFPLNNNNKLFSLFMAAIHLFGLPETQCKAWLKDKIDKKLLVNLLPLLCGLFSPDEGVDRLRQLFGLNPKNASSTTKTSSSSSNPSINGNKDVYVYLSTLSDVWIESQFCFLHCVHEAKLRPIRMRPPPAANRIVIDNNEDNMLNLHHVVALNHYLMHGDVLDGLHITNCHLDDQALLILPKSMASRTRHLELRQNYFGVKGLSHIFGASNRGSSLALSSLDLSDCDLDDEALARLAPLVPHLQQLVLADNFFTWYGIRKLVQLKSHWRVARLDMSRCHLNEHAFFELVSLLTRTNEVVLNGNAISPIEIKFLARHIKEKLNNNGNNSNNSEEKEKNLINGQDDNGSPTKRSETKYNKENSSPIKGNTSPVKQVSLKKMSSPKELSPKKLTNQIKSSTQNSRSSPKKLSNSNHNSSGPKKVGTVKSSSPTEESRVSDISQNSRRRLDRLYLECCEMDDACLLELLKIVPSLCHLSLRSNKFSSESMSALNKCLKKHSATSRLISLNLRDCKLNEEALANLVEVVARLEHVNLSNNAFNAPKESSINAVRQLIDTLRNNSSNKTLKLRKLEMRQCRLGDAHKRALADVCKQLRVELKLW